MSRSKGRLTLPDNPNLEQLREQAKERLELIRVDAPEAQLSDAQLALARDYGFLSWRALKAEVDRLGGVANGLVGDYAQQRASNAVFTITAKGQRLFLGHAKHGIIELIPQPDGAFAIPGLTLRYRFERDANGKAQALIIQTETGAPVRKARIGVEKAAQMRAERDRAAKAEWRARSAIEVPVDILERYVGYYADPIGAVMEFVREDRKLFMRTANKTQVPLDAESEVDFFVSVARVEFHFRVEGGVATSVVSRRLGTETVLSRIAPEAAARLNSSVLQRAAEQARPRQVAAPVPPDILARYAGRYRVANRLEIAVDVQEGRIFAQLFTAGGRPGRMEIFPESDTKFFWTTMAAQVEFFVDAEGKISHAIWHREGQLMPLTRIGETLNQAAPAA